MPMMSPHAATLIVAMSCIASGVVAAEPDAPSSNPREAYGQLEAVRLAWAPGGAAAVERGNGFDDVRRAMELLAAVEAEREGEAPPHPGTSTGRLARAVLENEASADERAELADRLAAAEQAGVFVALRGAVTAPTLTWPYPEPEEVSLTTMMLDGVNDLRPVHDILRAHAVLAAEAGEWDEATTTFDTAVRLGDAFMHRATNIEHQVGARVVGLAFAAMEDVVRRHDPPRDALAKLAATARRYAEPPPFTPAMQGFRVQIRQMLDMTHLNGTYQPWAMRRLLGNRRALTPDGGIVDDTPTAPEDEEPFATRDESWRHFLRYVELCERLAGEIDPVEREALQREIAAWRSGLGRRYAALDACVYHMERVIEDRLMPFRAERARTAVGLAAALYEHDHGELPSDAAALVPEYFDAVPIDPLTGQPVMLRLALIGKHAEDSEME